MTAKQLHLKFSAFNTNSTTLLRRKSGLFRLPN